MRVAPLRLRLQATCINLAVGLGCLATAIGLLTGALLAVVRIRGQRGKPGDRGGDRPMTDAVAARMDWFGSRRVLAAFHGAAWAIQAGQRNGRSVGYRVVGLREVDARTGGPVRLSSAVSGLLCDQASGAIATALSRPYARRHRDRVAALGPELAALKHEHREDPRACQAAITALYEAHDVHPWHGCASQLGTVVLWRLLLLLAERDGVTLRQRVTRTRVIIESSDS